MSKVLEALKKLKDALNEIPIDEIISDLEKAREEFSQLPPEMKEFFINCERQTMDFTKNEEK